MIDKFLLAPYYLTLKFRHFLYDKGLKKTARADVPTVCIGNITVGGTGKTPHTELTVRTLLEMPETAGKNIAVLSRGYGRRSKGFQQILPGDNADFAGDEPLQIKTKYPDITVAVDAKRVEGCDFLSHPEKAGTQPKGRECLHKDFPPADIIVLDDAFQHRALSPTISILLMDYSRPVSKDLLLPLGRLRDLRGRASAADVIIVTKSPAYIDETHKREWISDFLSLRNFDPDTLRGETPEGKMQTVLFTSVRYCEAAPVFPEGDQRYVYAKRAVAFSGIADDSRFMAYLAGKYKVVRHIAFSDHHKFSASDIGTISAAAMSEPTALVATTEKDSQRLKTMKKIPETLRKRMFRIPIEAYFLTEKEETVFRNLLLQAASSKPELKLDFREIHNDSSTNSLVLNNINSSNCR